MSYYPGHVIFALGVHFFVPISCLKVTKLPVNYIAILDRAQVVQRRWRSFLGVLKTRGYPELRSQLPLSNE